jgi:hypothetical protein
VFSGLLGVLCFLFCETMPSSRMKQAGVLFVFVGVSVYGTWILWLSTRADHPVDVPISMTVGHIRTREFRINQNAPYTVDIEVEKTIPFETLNCLLGITMARTSTALEECPDRPSVVKASWQLTSGGQIVAQGSSDEYRSGAWMNGSISRELGHFESQSGRRYVLDVDVLADGSALAPGNPRLKVEVRPEVYEVNAVWGAILFLGMGVLVLVGVILLAQTGQVTL